MKQDAWEGSDEEVSTWSRTVTPPLEAVIVRLVTVLITLVKTLRKPSLIASVACTPAPMLVIWHFLGLALHTSRSLRSAVSFEADGGDARLDRLGRRLGLGGGSVGENQQHEELLALEHPLLHAPLVLGRLEGLALVDHVVDGMPQLRAARGVQWLDHGGAQRGAAGPGQQRVDVAVECSDAHEVTLAHAARLEEQEEELLVHLLDGPAAH